MVRILIVDDEADVRRLVRRWISDAGREIAEANSADVALEVMAARPADVVFCDVQMPGGPDGLWLTGELRWRHPSVAVVLATGVSTVAPVISLQAGVIAYLVKPFEREQVLEALATAVKWHQDNQAAGPQPDDVGDRLTAWLESLDDGT